MGRRRLTVATVLVLLAVLGAHWLQGFDESVPDPGSSVPPTDTEAETAPTPDGGSLPVTRPSRDARGTPGWERATPGRLQDTPDALEAVTDSVETEVRWIGDPLDPEDHVPEALQPVALGEILDPDDPDSEYFDTAEGEVIDLGPDLDPDAPLREMSDPGPPVHIGEPRDVDVH